jgi:hypothetical protein
MANPIPVIGLSPVTFASEDSATLGQEFQIPLSALTFDAAKGIVDPSAWPPIKSKKLGAKDSALVPLLLADLLKRGVLSAPSA